MDSIFSQVFGGAALIWPNVTLMVAIFVLLIFHPERIANFWLLRLGCVLFAVSLIIPTVGSLIPIPTTDMQIRHNPNMIWVKLCGVLQTIVFTASFLATTWSIVQSSPTQEDRT